LLDARQQGVGRSRNRAVEHDQLGAHVLGSNVLLVVLDLVYGHRLDQM
jgi:hypothetical protein